MGKETHRVVTEPHYISRSVVNVTVVIGLSNNVLPISKKLGEKIWNVFTTKT